MASTVTDDPEESRYESRIDGSLAGLATYTLSGHTITFDHTEVYDAYEGQGVGSALARFALDDARARSLRVRARCPFIRAWIERHPDYQDLLA